MKKSTKKIYKISIATLLLAAAIWAFFRVWKERKSYETNEKHYTPPPGEIPPRIPHTTIPANESDNVDTTTNQYIVPSFCPNSPQVYASTAHFDQSEFDCKDGTPVPDSQKGLLQELMENLEVVRADFGGAPIGINSAFRTISHNRNEGGADYSQHLCAMAADIVVSNQTPQTVFNRMKQLMDEGKIKKGGLRAYPTFVHYDTRGYFVTW